MRARQRRKMGLKRYVLVGAMLLTSACAGNLTPKGQIDKWDRTAYTALRSFQVAEEAAWHGKQAWPTADEHQKIGKALSEAYVLVVDVANAGLAIRPNQPAPQQVQATITKLLQLVSDIVTFSARAPDTAQAKAKDAQTSAVQLAQAVLTRK